MSPRTRRVTTLGLMGVRLKMMMRKRMRRRMVCGLRKVDSHFGGSEERREMKFSRRGIGRRLRKERSK